jgi:CPA1 family monovalent cation:H+ antiporter
VIYALAVSVTLGAIHFSVGRLGIMFVRSYVGGVATGAVVTFLCVQVRRRLTDAFEHSLFALVTALTAYLVSSSSSPPA